MTIHVPYRYDASAFRNVFEQSFTYLSGVERNSHRFAARTALHDPLTDRRWSYSELWSDVGRLAAGLSAHGIRAGDVIVFQLFNCPEGIRSCAPLTYPSMLAPRAAPVRQGQRRGGRGDRSVGEVRVCLRQPT
ncbi:MAG: AMP-binding protein [Solirubrobacteraceae bacterium]